MNTTKSELEVKRQISNLEDNIVPVLSKSQLAAEQREARFTVDRKSNKKQ